MTICSMTGFGRSEVSGGSYSVSVEVKSVNNRFKDYRFKTPGSLNFLEKKLKDTLDEKFKRGTFDIYVNIKKSDNLENQFDFDSKKIKTFLSEFKKASGISDDALSLNPIDFMKREFTVDDSEIKEKELPSLVLKALGDACKELEESRKQEGKKLIAILKQHQADYESHYEKVKKLRGSFETVLKEKLRKKFEENSDLVKVDEPRFLQEVIYYLEKLDIDEEINRISSHLKKLNEILDSDNEVGRQIDFLVQELNRETNTIGSKSANTDVSDNVIQMKVQLEKIREQALNLE